MKSADRYKLVTDLPGERPVLWEWLSSRIELPWSTDLRTLGIMRPNFTFAAVAGYNTWVGKSCSMHFAVDSPRSITKDLLREAFKYPFISCEKPVDTIYGLTPITYASTLAFKEHIGFREILRTPSFILHEMNREDCKWIKGLSDEQRISTTRT